MAKVHYALLLLSLSLDLVLSVDICENQLNGIRLAHPADCTKFVVCKNAKTDHFMSCPLGLHFNRFEGVCDFKVNAACDEVFVRPSVRDVDDCSACCSDCDCGNSTPATPSIPSVTPDNPGICSSNLTVCVGKPNGSFAYVDGNCNQYIVCIFDCAVVMDCPSDLEFNLVLNGCDYPENADCPWSSNPGTSGTPAPNTPVASDSPVTPDTPVTPAPDTPVTPDTPDTPETPVTPDTSVTPEIPSPPGGTCSNDLTVCANKTDGSNAYVNGTCNQYVVCVGGCAIIMTCPNNLQYNISTKACDYPQNVECPWESTPPLGPSTGPSGTRCEQRGQCAGQADGAMFANPNSSGYIVCQCECEIEMPCPAGTVFDEEIETCNNINTAQQKFGNGK